MFAHNFVDCLSILVMGDPLQDLIALARAVTATLSGPLEESFWISICDLLEALDNP
jgi:hypothetical protein